MTVVIAIAPLALTPLVVWLLAEYGPERSVVFAVYWLLLSIAFAIAMPLFRRRGNSLAVSSVYGVVVGLLATSLVVVGLLFACAPKVNVATPASGPQTVASPPKLVISDVPMR